MQVVELGTYGGALQVVERAEPVAGPGQVVVRLLASSVNPVDWLVAAGVLAGMTPHLTPPLVLGWDLVGEVAQVGQGAPYAVGDGVAAMLPWFADGVGAWAELLVVDPAWLAPLPAGVDAGEAATLPLNGTTARQALDLVGLSAGQTLLVTGGSGGVGGYAVQLAAAQELRVLATASAGDEDRVRALGAERVVPRGDALLEAVHGVDGVLDAVPVGPQLIGAVRDGGSFVTVLDTAIPVAERGVRVAKVSVEPDAAQLSTLLQALAAGRLSTRVAHRLPLTHAGKAMELASGGGLSGKVLLEA